MISKYTIYGERCSGTWYLEQIMDLNFKTQLSWEYGWKHFFGFQDEKLLNSDDILFICIVRNLPDWINSLYREKHHLQLKYKNFLNEKEKINEFLNLEFFSVQDSDNDEKNWSKEIMEDRNIYTGKRYKNIFELRRTKIKWMLEDLPKKVKNYIFITHEQLKYNFNNTLNKIKDKGLELNDNIKFPINSEFYKKSKIHKYDKNFIPQKFISDNTILNNPNLDKYYEQKIGYLKSNNNNLRNNYNSKNNKNLKNNNVNILSTNNIKLSSRLKMKFY